MVFYNDKTLTHSSLKCILIEDKQKVVKHFSEQKVLQECLCFKKEHVSGNTKALTAGVNYLTAALNANSSQFTSFKFKEIHKLIRLSNQTPVEKEEVLKLKELKKLLTEVKTQSSMVSFQNFFVTNAFLFATFNSPEEHLKKYEADKEFKSRWYNEPEISYDEHGNVIPVDELDEIFDLPPVSKKSTFLNSLALKVAELPEMNQVTHAGLKIKDVLSFLDALKTKTFEEASNDLIALVLEKYQHDYVFPLGNYHQSPLSKIQSFLNVIKKALTIYETNKSDQKYLIKIEDKLLSFIEDSNIFRKNDLEIIYQIIASHDVSFGANSLTLAVSEEIALFLTDIFILKDDYSVRSILQNLGPCEENWFKVCETALIVSQLPDLTVSSFEQAKMLEG